VCVCIYIYIYIYKHFIQYFLLEAVGWITKAHHMSSSPCVFLITRYAAF